MVSHECNLHTKLPGQHSPLEVPQSCYQEHTHVKSEIEFQKKCYFWNILGVDRSCSPLCGWIKAAARALNVVMPVHTVSLLTILAREMRIWPARALNMILPVHTVSLLTILACEMRIWPAVVMAKCLLAFCILLEVIRTLSKCWIQQKWLTSLAFIWERG